MSLGLFRSDYFYCESSRGLKQVEFNTIASSFGGLTSQLVGAHRSVSKNPPPLFFLAHKDFVLSSDTYWASWESMLIQRM